MLVSIGALYDVDIERGIRQVQINSGSGGRERLWEGRAEGTEPLRADRYIAEIAKVLTRSQIKARNARVFVNGREAKLSRKLEPGDRIELRWTEEPSRNLVPERLDVPVVYEDGNLFVFDKPQGMVTHPAAGNWSGTLANAALWLDGERGAARVDRSAPPRGGIVHRLDKDTSGVIVVARNAAAQEYLASQFKSRAARKEYLAFVRGSPPDRTGRIENRLARDRRDRKKFAATAEGGKLAVTDYKVLAVWDAGGGESYALVALYPRTGRTHQLRVHMAGLRCPIVGDPIYGTKDGRFPDVSLMLHARRLSIAIPGVEQRALFEAPVPLRFRQLKAALDARFGRRP